MLIYPHSICLLHSPFSFCLSIISLILAISELIFQLTRFGATKPLTLVAIMMIAITIKFAILDDVN